MVMVVKQVIGSATVSTLMRAVELDTKKRYTEALDYYREGIQMLIADKIRTENTGEHEIYFTKKIEEYTRRAESIKNLVLKLKEEGKFHEQQLIPENSTGQSYKNMLGRFLDETVDFVLVEDPNIKSAYQLANFCAFCNDVIKSCQNIKQIHLRTSTNTVSAEHQHENFGLLKNELREEGVQLTIEYCDVIKEKQIIISSGWIIKIDRGLDIYKELATELCLGAVNLNFRKCHGTTINILHSKNVKQLYKL